MIAVGLGNGQINVYDYKDGSVVFTMAHPSGDLQSGSDGTFKMSSVRCLKWTDIYLGRPSQAPFFGIHVSYPCHLEESIVDEDPLGIKRTPC
jgi:hypothetical protein